MKRLLCRWVEYYLALSDEDTERPLPAWVRRHLETCAHCQAALEAYRHTLEMVHQYAELLPSAPPQGWRPLEVTPGRARRPVRWWQMAAVAGAAAMVLWAAMLWQRGIVWVDEQNATPQLAQGGTAPQRVEVTPRSTPFVPAPPAPVGRKVSEPQESKQARPATPQPPAPAKRSLPAMPPPPRRLVVAAQPKQMGAPAAHHATAAEPQPEPPAPVQPVLAEASPSPSTEVPEAYVLQPAYAAAAGGVE